MDFFSTCSSQHVGCQMIIDVLQQAGASPQKIAQVIEPIEERRQLRTIVRCTRETYQPLLGGRYMDALEDPRLN